MASDSENTTMIIDEIVTNLKSLDVSELFKLIKAATSEAEKKSKVTAKRVDADAPRKKAGSMPKGAVPPQLKKPRAWVEFTLKYALENGWESFTVLQKKKVKGEGGQDVSLEEQIEMPASVLHNGAHIYKDSITEKTPEGRQIIHKEAMSLSKQRKESGHPTYVEFEASYVDETTDDDKSDAGSSVASSSHKIVVKKTAAEKEAESAAKKAEKEAAKAAAKEAKEAEKAAKKAEKEAEKAAKKAEKEQEKAAKKPVTKAPVPAAALKKTTTEPVAPPAPQAQQKKKVLAAKVEEIPNDGMVHPCTIKGKKYLRNADGETWLMGADGGVGEWAGMYDAKADKLDTSAPEPVFEDEE
jgi:hypothetical protein